MSSGATAAGRWACHPKDVTDPHRRFIRGDEYVAIGPSLVLYKGYDSQTGLLVTWHEILFPSLADPARGASVCAHANRVKELKHENLAALFDFWISPDSTRAFFITEAVESRSVVDTFVRDATVVPSRVIARWFTVILRLLHFLHSQSPPLIHHKIQLSSIFVRSSSACIKVGLPLLVPRKVFMGHSIIKISAMTPPEYLYGEATPASDIWCFGLTLLEVITKTLPYAECKTPRELIDKLLRYQPPDCIEGVTDPVGRPDPLVPATAPAQTARQGVDRPQVLHEGLQR
jgi:WNK lysine deficient protein kinase